MHLTVEDFIIIIFNYVFTVFTCPLALFTVVLLSIFLLGSFPALSLGVMFLSKKKNTNISWPYLKHALSFLPQEVL